MDVDGDNDDNTSAIDSSGRSAHALAPLLALPPPPPPPPSATATEACGKNRPIGG